MSDRYPEILCHFPRRHTSTQQLFGRRDLAGVPVAGVQKTTIRTFTVEGEEKNEGLRPHILVAKTPDFAHVYCGISGVSHLLHGCSWT
jgi:hypothetical protein